METQKLTIVNPTEFGIKEEEAKSLTSGLDVTIKEREVLKDAFLDVIEMEITEDNINTFKELRLKFVKNRTQGFDKWRKTQKAYFLAGGNFVQAIYNKEIAINEEMETKLMNAEKHFENLEKERIDKLQSERIELISPYLESTENLVLSGMDEDVWNAYFSTKKKQHEDKIAAEKEAERLRIEAEKKEAERIKAQEIENAKLKEEAEKREKEIAAERKRQAERTKLLQPYIVFIRDYNELISKPEKEFKKELDKIKIGAEQHWEHQKQKEAESRRIEAENKKKLDAERKERERIEAELKAKKEAEELAKKKEENRLAKEKAAAEKLAKAPIKKQMKEWVLSLTCGTPPVLNDETKDIVDKFEKFRNWALLEVEKL